MPASDRERPRRWTAREVPQLIAESPLQTPRYELVDGELLVTPSPTVPRTVRIRYPTGARVFKQEARHDDTNIVYVVSDTLASRR